MYSSICTLALTKSTFRCKYYIYICKTLFIANETKTFYNNFKK